MKNSLNRSLRKKKRSLENLADIVSGIDYIEIGKKQKQFLQNLLVTNENLLRSNNVNNLLLF